MEAYGAEHAHLRPPRLKQAWTGRMYTDFPPGSDADALHAALFAGAIARFQALPEMQAIVAFTRAFLEERLAPHEPVRLHRIEGDLGERCRSLQRDYPMRRRPSSCGAC